MSTQPPIPSVGQIVALRQRLYLVEQSAGPVKHGDSMLVRLACLDDDAQGQTLEVLGAIEQALALGNVPPILDRSGDLPDIKPG